MAIHCPKCGAEIDLLYAFVKAERKYDITLEDFTSGQELYWDERDVYTDETAPVDFECPECNELLFHDEEQVLKFMQWGDLYPWRGVDDYGQKDKDTDQSED